MRRSAFGPSIRLRRPVAAVHNDRLSHAGASQVLLYGPKRFDEPDRNLNVTDARVDVRVAQHGAKPVVTGFVDRGTVERKGLGGAFSGVLPDEPKRVRLAGSRTDRQRQGSDGCARACNKSASAGYAHAL